MDPRLKVAISFFLAALIILLGFCSCGTDQGKSDPNYQGDPRCLSCDLPVPDEDVSISGNGCLQISPEELGFFCINYENCVDTKSMFVLNTNKQLAVVYSVNILSNDNFEIVKTSTELPIILKQNEFIEIRVRFNWNTRYQIGYIEIITEEEQHKHTFGLPLVGKMFIIGEN